MPIVPIGSATDPRIRDYLDVAHPDRLRRAGLFVAEGRLVVERLLASGGYRVRSLLLTPPALDALVGGGREALTAPDTPIFVADQQVMNSIAGFNIHRGCLALAERPPIRTLAEQSTESLRRVVVLEGVNNPDNVGGLFRSAAAFAADLMVLGPGCGDPLYRKAIRTSMAAALQVPVATAGAWPDALDRLRRDGLRIVALSTAPGSRVLEEMPRGRAVAILLGNEGDGLSREALAAADVRVRIRMASRVDSLNVNVAAAIAMHHLFAHDEPSR